MKKKEKKILKEIIVICITLTTFETNTQPINDAINQSPVDEKKQQSFEICSQANYLNREELVVATFDLSSPKLPPSTKSRFSFAPQGEQNKVRNQASSALQENKFLSLFF